MEQEYINGLEWLKVYESFPSALNPHAESVQAQTVDWAVQFRLVESQADIARLDATRLGYLAGRFHPQASHELLQIIASWYTWMFVRDDQRDESDLGRYPQLLAAQDAQLLVILKGTARPPADATALTLAFWDLTRRLRSHVPTKYWLRRFIRTIRSHFDAVVWEATNRAHDVTPDLTTYKQMRPLTGGMHVDAAFIQLAGGIQLPPDVQNEPTVRRLTEASNNAVCWANDLLSLAKEQRIGDVHNLVLVLMAHEGLTEIEARSRAIEFHASEVQTFLSLAGQLPVLGAPIDDNLHRYVAALHTRMRGNVDWARQSERYSERPVSSNGTSASRSSRQLAEASSRTIVTWDARGQAGSAAD